MFFYAIFAIIIFGNLCESLDQEPRCFEPIVAGPCMASMSAYAYDANTQQCVHFYYGGCLGSNNRFNSKEECAASCELGSLKQLVATFDVARDTQQQRCLLPIETGPCNALFPSWGYDTKQRKCVPFIYGGCQGNDNQFDSEHECESACDNEALLYD